MPLGASPALCGPPRITDFIERDILDLFTDQALTYIKNVLPLAELRASSTTYRASFVIHVATYLYRKPEI